MRNSESDDAILKDLQDGGINVDLIKMKAEWMGSHYADEIRRKGEWFSSHPPGQR